LVTVRFKVFKENRSLDCVEGSVFEEEFEERKGFVDEEGESEGDEEDEPVRSPLDGA
jgi:hypothetical protein